MKSSLTFTRGNLIDEKLEMQRQMRKLELGKGEKAYWQNLQKEYGSGDSMGCTVSTKKFENKVQLYSVCIIFQSTEPNTGIFYMNWIVKIIRNNRFFPATFFIGEKKTLNGTFLNENYYLCLKTKNKPKNRLV